MRALTNEAFDNPVLLSRLGRDGRPIRAHRSLATLRFPPARIISMILLPLGFDLALWALYEPITLGWGMFFGFWLDKLGIAGFVTYEDFPYHLIDSTFPHIDVAAPYPDPRLWWATLAATLAGYPVARRIRQDFLPLSYLMLFALAIQAFALALWHSPNPGFSNSLENHIEMQLAVAMGFIAFIPWLYGLIYHIFDFSPWKKLGLTLMTLVFLIVAVPFQVMAHIFLVVKFSMLFLPLLYLMFGMFPIVLCCIALYGWGMSWAPGRSGWDYSRYAVEPNPSV